MTEITTADGIILHEGDRAYNHYDMKPGTIERIDSHPQPDTMKGQDCNTPIHLWDNFWFTFRHDDGSSALLDGSRIVSTEFARSRRYTDA